MTARQPCPVMVRAKLEPSTCDFPELCGPGRTYPCFWAKFHQIDPETGKPAGSAEVAAASAQKDLFA